MISRLKLSGSHIFSQRYPIIAIATFIFVLCLLPFRNRISLSGVFPSTVPLAHSKYAYCTFLSPDTQATGNSLDNEDHYFTGTRMLIYQLLHDPVTRTTSSIPVIVLVTTDVPQSTRDRLTKDGATVVEVSPLSFDWIKPGRERWMRVMDKLHVFELVEFEKILLLDTDIIILKPLDAIFDEAAADVLPNLGKAAQIHADEAPQPPTYLMAGIGDSSKAKGLNAGFVLLRPSLEIYHHYLSIAAIEGRFDGAWPEQDLWNYVHSPDGNMPWKPIPPHWTANSPTYQDYENGISSVHEKYWRCEWDQKLRAVLLKSRFEMEGYWKGIGLDHK